MTTDVGKTMSPKALAATAGAGAGAIVTALLLWVIGAGMSGDWTATGADSALAAVPAPLGAFVGLLVAVAFTLIPSWWITDHVRDVGAAVIDARPDDLPGELASLELEAPAYAPEAAGPDATPTGDGEEPYTGARGL